MMQGKITLVLTAMPTITKNEDGTYLLEIPCSTEFGSSAELGTFMNDVVTKFDECDQRLIVLENKFKTLATTATELGK